MSAAVTQHLWAFDNIPAELRPLKQWVLWRYEAGDNGKKKKVPINALTGRNASVSNAADWHDFETVAAYYNTNVAVDLCSGIGMVFCSGLSGYAGIDIDDAGGDENVLRAHTRIIEAFSPYSYIERSPSNTGLHIITKGKIEGRRRNGVEAYSDGRFFTFTGNVLHQQPIRDCQHVLDQLQRELSPAHKLPALLSSEPETADDETVLQRMWNAANGARARDLFNGTDANPDQSATDLALCNIIAWHTKNVEQVERLWLSSIPGQRDKVQRRRDYRLRTIATAFDRHTEQQAAMMVVDFSTVLAKARATAPSVPPVGSHFPAIAAHSGAGDATRTLWTTADFRLDANEGYVIKHLIAPGNVGALLGHPGAGKSTLAPLLAYAVAQGWPVFGLRTRRGRTLYLAAEDEKGVKKRLYALALKHGHASNCAVIDCGNLREAEAAKRAMDAVATFAPTLVVLDTVGAAFAGIDENASRDMGMVVDWARSIAAVGPAVLLVHHIAKASGGEGVATARGHGILNGTLDVSILLTPDDVTDANALIRITLGKNRNGTTAQNHAFRKDIVTLGIDADGEYITTTLPIEEPISNSKPITQLPKQARKALVLLKSMIQDATNGRVVESDWRSHCDDQRMSTSASSKTRKEAFNAAYDRLLNEGCIAVGDGMVWIPTSG